jgi:tripartite-type tricarboxylate transporter receptor subunit TctC
MTNVSLPGIWLRLCLPLCALLACDAAQAQDVYPSRVLKMVVPYTAGGTGDVIGRLMGNKLAEVLGQQVIVENRPGAGGNIGAIATARSAPDGYTMVITSIGLSSNPSLQKKPTLDPVKELIAVSQCCGVPMVVVVHPSLPIRSVAELVAHAKANPGRLTFASSGVGTSSHLAAELFKIQAGVDMTHVPYKADSQAMPDLLGGTVSLMFMFQTAALPQIKAGKLRPLAVSTLARSPMLPELPTVAEAGVPGYDFNSWFGTFVAAGTPRPVVDKLAAALVKAVQSPDLKAKLLENGFVPVGDASADFDRFFKADVAKWARVQREGKLPQID